MAMGFSPLDPLGSGAKPLGPGGSFFTTARSCPEVVHSAGVIHPLLPAPLLPDYDDGLFTGGLRHQGAPPFPPHPSPWRGAGYSRGRTLPQAIGRAATL